MRSLRIVLIPAVIYLVGCSSSMTPGMALNTEVQPSLPENAGGRALIQEAQLELQTEDMRRVHQGAMTIVARAGGRVDEAKVGERDYRATFRVPAGDLTTVLDALEELGDVRSRKLSAQDVTEQSIDLEARLSNLIVLRNRLQKHVERAQRLDEILRLEQELTRVQTEIEAIQARLKTLRQRVRMASLELRASRKVVLGPVGYAVHKTGWLVSKLFVWKD